MSGDGNKKNKQGKMLKQDDVYRGFLVTVEICLETFMVKTFKVFSFSLQTSVEQLFTCNKVQTRRHTL